MNRWILISVIVLSSIYVSAQPRIQKPDNPQDTNYTFESPRPLLKASPEFRSLNKAWGLDLLFSNSGFGAGFFYQIKFAKYYNAFASLYISGARNTDEFEYYDPIENKIVIPGKINRVFMFPMTFGIQRTIFNETLSDNIRPFLDAGVGPSFILTTPYDREFFNAFGHSQSYVRFGAFIGCGSYIGNEGKNLMSVNFRYYFIPFGGDGIESIQGNPIKDFGGLFLSLSIGLRY
jgi:hypothetical protein